MVCQFNRGTKIFIIFISASTDFAVQALQRGPDGVKLSLYITFSPSLSPLPLLQKNTKGKKYLCKLIMQESRGAFSFLHLLCFPLKHFRNVNTGFYFICSLFHNMVKVIPKRSIYFCLLEYMFLTSSCLTIAMWCFGANMPIIRAPVQ